MREREMGQAGNIFCHRINGFEVEDIHTHRSDDLGAVLSVAPDVLKSLAQEHLYSVSLHPWYVSLAAMDAFSVAVAERSNDRHWIAVGECGLDGLCTTSPELQEKAFELSLVAARDYGRPAVIHCVRRWDGLSAVVRRVWGAKGAAAAFESGTPLIIHGFRKGVQMARQLLSAGFSLSLGEHFQEEVACIIPADRLFLESDESQMTIGEIKEKVYLCRIR